jgi:hypothetical protein
MNAIIKWILRELAWIRQRLEKIDVQWRMPEPTPELRLVIDKGNILETGEDGIVFATSEITSVPSAYDPTVDDSFIDGIGRGYLYVNGAARDDMVLIVNDGSGTFPDALRQSDVIYSGGLKQIPVDGGGSVIAYVTG